MRELRQAGVEVFWVLSVKERREKVGRRGKCRMDFNFKGSSLSTCSYSVGGTDGMERDKLDIEERKAHNKQAQFVWMTGGVQVRKRVSVLNRTMDTLLFL